VSSPSGRDVRQAVGASCDGSGCCVTRARCFCEACGSRLSLPGRFLELSASRKGGPCGGTIKAPILALAGGLVVWVDGPSCRRSEAQPLSCGEPVSGPLLACVVHCHRGGCSSLEKRGTGTSQDIECLWHYATCRISPRLLRRSLPYAAGKVLALPASRAARASSPSSSPLGFWLRRLEEKVRVEVGAVLPHHQQGFEDLALGVAPPATVGSTPSARSSKPCG
jgi:hypothetical protein